MVQTLTLKPMGIEAQEVKQSHMGKYRICTRISIIKLNTKALSTSYLSLVERHFNRQPRVKPHYIKTIFLLSMAQGSHKEVVNIRKHDYSSMSDDLRNRALLFWLLQFSL